MYIIGITGGTGAGKTTAALALQKLGAYILDCDEIYHELLQANTELSAKIKERFIGVSANGVIDLKKLGKIVFNDPAALHELSMISHPFIIDEIDRKIALFKAQGGSIAVIDAIALIESGQSHKCDITIGVTAPEDIRITRIMERDKLTHEQAHMRVNAQQPDKFYADNCDYILEGTYDRQEEFERIHRDFFIELLAGLASHSE